jgi:hypothetical protein
VLGKTQENKRGTQAERKQETSRVHSVMSVATACLPDVLINLRKVQFSVK